MALLRGGKGNSDLARTQSSDVWINVQFVLLLRKDLWSSFYREITGVIFHLVHVLVLLVS